MTYFKGLTEDGFSDIWFKNTARTKLINDLWRNHIKIKLHKIFRAKLVPLNKVWPYIPKMNQFRSIVMLSDKLKFLE